MTSDGSTTGQEAIPVERYSHGHHESVLRSHLWRTAENSAAVLLPQLKPSDHLLDVGCGPATISADLARLLPLGAVTGVDNADGAVAAAAEAAAQVPNLSIQQANVYDLPFSDGSFDVVFAHQVLQHLVDPVAALRELRRVLRVGGLLAVRDSDYGAFTWTPPTPLFNRWLEIYKAVTTANKAEADAGRYLSSWVGEAGFHELQITTSTWHFSSDEDRRWWGGLWSDRVRFSAFAEQVCAIGASTQDELEAISRAFLEWSSTSGATFTIPHGEVLATK